MDMMISGEGLLKNLINQRAKLREAVSIKNAEHRAYIGELNGRLTEIDNVIGHVEREIERAQREESARTEKAKNALEAKPKHVADEKFIKGYVA